MKTDKIIQLGNTCQTPNRDNPQRGRVYDPRGLAPTICTYGGGDLEPKVLLKTKMKEYIITQKCGDRGTSNYSFSDISYTIPANPMSDRGQLLIEKEMEDKGILFKGHTLHDGDGLYLDTSQEFFRGGLKGISRTIKAESNDAAVCLLQESKEKQINNNMEENNENKKGIAYNEQEDSFCQIRKLTPRECFRLQDVDDKDIDKIFDAGISKSQCYKLAGNSITVAPMYFIFENLFCKEYDNKAKETLF